MSAPQLLFSVDEAFMRLGQVKGHGCMLVFNTQDAVHIFVKDGLVVSASVGEKSGEEALDRALTMPESAYRWIPDAEPSTANLKINIQEYISQRTRSTEARFGKTIKIDMYEKREKKLDFQYYFVPEEAPTSKLRIRKVANVVGRETTCDLYIESFQVSRRHCLLEVTDQGLLVKDLESTNGTFVNGAPLKNGYINDGDRLSLGTYVLTLRREKA
jgi:hypothetical protein